MSFVSNLRLAARLGLAFAALIIGLVAVAVSGTLAVGGLQSDVNDLTSRDMVELQLLGVTSQAFSTQHRLVTDHLYVFDGDLSAQDKLQKEFNRLAAAEEKANEQFAGLVRNPEIKALFEADSAAREKMEVQYEKALKLSRAETVANVEERDGSRTVYTDAITPLTAEVSAANVALTDALTGQARAKAEAADATAADSKRLILIVSGIALALAIGLATWITRSVTKPVGALSARLRSLNEQDFAELETGLQAVAAGDLTRDVKPVTEPLVIKSRDEIGQLSETFNEMLGKAQGGIASYNEMRAQVSSALNEVSANAGTVSSASQQMAATSKETGRAVDDIAHAVTEVAEGAEQQVRMIEAARSSIEEAARAVAVSAESAENTAEAAGQARAVAVEGVTAAEEATGAMREVTASQHNVTEAIRGLSQRTERI
nr:methyl-accepting chemotaxis protein [Solirubrobacterales bacterium]